MYKGNKHSFRKLKSHTRAKEYTIPFKHFATHTSIFFAFTKNHTVNTNHK